MDAAQILLIIVVLILTAILTLIGVELFFILREFRETVRKVNKILDDTGLITQSVAQPIAGFSGFLTGLKSGAGLVKFLTNQLDDEDQEEEEEEDE
jgi:hypothetical protein